MSKTFKSNGIVFKSLKYSETSLILDIYTQVHGLGSYIVSGVRKTKSRKANIYHPMNILDIVAYNPSESLSRIKEAQYAVTYQMLDRDVIRASLGTYFIDLLRSSIKEKEPNKELFSYIVSQLLDLDNREYNVRNAPIKMAVELASYLGFQMDSNYSEDAAYFDLRAGYFVAKDVSHKYVLDKETSQALHQLFYSSFSCQLSRQLRHEVLDALMIYYKIHIEGFHELRSLPILRTLLS